MYLPPGVGRRGSPPELFSNLPSRKERKNPPCQFYTSEKVCLFAARRGGNNPRWQFHTGTETAIYNRNAFSPLGRIHRMSFATLCCRRPLQGGPPAGAISAIIFLIRLFVNQMSGLNGLRLIPPTPLWSVLQSMHLCMRASASLCIRESVHLRGYLCAHACVFAHACECVACVCTRTIASVGETR